MDGRPRLSILVVTSGRPTLPRTVRSILDAGFGEGDEVVVMTDGPVDPGMLDGIPSGQLTVLEHPRTDKMHRAGVLRNKAMPAATGDWLLFMDDDDVYTHGALIRVRYHAGRNPGRPLVFRMVAPWGETLWRLGSRKMVSFANVGTPMIVVPNDPERLGVWGCQQNSDWRFVRTTMEKYSKGSAVLLDDTICICNPDTEVGWATRG